MFDRLKTLYDAGKIGIAQLDRAVFLQLITLEQKNEIIKMDN
jgi:hypothetical protein